MARWKARTLKCDWKSFRSHHHWTLWKWLKGNFSVWRSFSEKWKSLNCVFNIWYLPEIYFMEIRFQALFSHSLCMYNSKSWITIVFIAMGNIIRHIFIFMISHTKLLVIWFQWPNKKKYLRFFSSSSIYGYDSYILSLSLFILLKRKKGKRKFLFLSFFLSEVTSKFISFFSFIKFSIVFRKSYSPRFLPFDMAEARGEVWGFKSKQSSIGSEILKSPLETDKCGIVLRFKTICEL